MDGVELIREVLHIELVQGVEPPEDILELRIARRGRPGPLEQIGVDWGHRPLAGDGDRLIGVHMPSLSDRPISQIAPCSRAAPTSLGTRPVSSRCVHAAATTARTASTDPGAPAANVTA